MNMEEKYPRLYRRHNRKVKGFAGQGRICHDGDCGIYNAFLKICTCGLHHQLKIITNGDAIKIYPKYWEEMSGEALAETLLQLVEEGALWMRCDECDGSGDIPVAVQDCQICNGKGFVPFKMPEPISDEEAYQIFRDVFGKKGKNEDES